MEVKAEEEQPKAKKATEPVVNITQDGWKLKLISLRADLMRSWWVLKVIGLIIFLGHISLPLFILYNSWIVPKLVFSTVVRWPPFSDPAYPTDYGLNATRNFYLDVQEDVRVGVWHTLPSSLSVGEEVSWEEYDQTLPSAKHIFLYLHGNSGTRGAYHRVQMYKFLSRLDAHVVTLDYRGFAESTGSPTEEGVVKDAHFMYKWLKEKSNGSPVVIWGHSLGTGISTKLTKQLCDEGDPPAGLVLESPFNNIVDAAFEHPFAFLFNGIPGFKSFLRDSAVEHNVRFNSDQLIRGVTSPILILHAEDDLIVPFHLGLKLYESAKKTRSHRTGGVEMVNFESHFGYGHKNIYKAPELKEIVKKFLETCHQHQLQ
ncbi:lysophosphatidylserine lipase ABHD12-like [Babylonia areolata]|uniref:lysophosphatidylserine lipase ABHD12-like n=1 Tax=Babylonia areolata TaxID=304850 RepID=UPI003FD6ACA4